MFRIRQFFLNIRLRRKLLYGSLLIFTFLIGISAIAIYLQVRNAIESNMEFQLSSSTKNIVKMISSTADISIKNYLRAISEKNKDIVNDFYLQYKNGQISETNAKEAARKILQTQLIGKTGYIYCIDTFGIVKIHPVKSMIGKDISKYDFIREQIRRKSGYLEYNWKNIGEPIERPKAIVMTYFEPWNWIISVSAHRDEFIDLLEISDIKEKVSYSKKSKRSKI